MKDVNKGHPVILSVLDKAVLLIGEPLNDCHITFPQQLLQQFPGTKGLQSTLY